MAPVVLWSLSSFFLTNVYLIYQSILARSPLSFTFSTPYMTINQGIIYKKNNQGIFHKKNYPFYVWDPGYFVVLSQFSSLYENDRKVVVEGEIRSIFGVM